MFSKSNISKFPTLKYFDIFIDRIIAEEALG